MLSNEPAPLIQVSNDPALAREQELDLVLGIIFQFVFDVGPANAAGAVQLVLELVHVLLANFHAKPQVTIHAALAGDPEIIFNYITQHLVL